MQNMPTLYSTIFITTSLLFLVVSAALAYVYARNKNRSYGELSVVFLFMSVHSLLTGAPVLFTSSLLLVGALHILGKVAAFGSLVVAFEIPRRLILHSEHPLVQVIRAGAISGALITLVMFLVTFPMPTITDSAIIWNEHWFAALSSSIFFLLYGVVWGALFYRYAMSLPRGNTRLQTLALAFAGTAMAFAGFVGFAAESATLIYVAILLVIAVAGMSFFAFFLRL